MLHLQWSVVTYFTAYGLIVIILQLIIWMYALWITVEIANHLETDCRAYCTASVQTQSKPKPWFCCIPSLAPDLWLLWNSSLVPSRQVTAGANEVMVRLRALAWTRQAVIPSVAKLVNTLCLPVSVWRSVFFQVRVREYAVRPGCVRNGGRPHSFCVCVLGAREHTCLC